MKLRIILYLLLSTQLYCEVSTMSGFLNDNYTGNRANGEKGNYVGADDFLTFALFNRTTLDNISVNSTWQIVTSRKFRYRYDIIEPEFQYMFTLDFLDIKPGLGLIFKGEFGGENFQNSFHDLRDIPHLNLNYLNSEFALFISMSLLYNLELIDINLDLNIPTGIKPINSNISFSFDHSFDFFSIELDAGYRFYLNSIESYSNFLKEGFNGGAQFKIRILGLDIAGGAYFFQSQNLESDPTYVKKEFFFSPQFWVAIGFNGEALKIADIVNI